MTENVTREQYQEAYQGGLTSELSARSPYTSGILAAAWRSGRRKNLSDRHAGIEQRVKAAAQEVR
ncbi:hypothetical protein L5G28_07750 [Gordonia sp. HY285]|uniref:hypothetical protein n=1 Tax=Gordonia liuliyuniae TaxID=2911517 RepID=UPI001F1C6BD4|nr:hypothetical protein [Gordonia liuliyuniae]MCF8610055.1 hypothetical protein [Gordonia liuliyuniae]